MVVFLLTAAALVLRAYDIAFESLWMDEAYSLRSASLGFREMIAAIQSGHWDLHPPFYFMMLRAWTGLFGTSELATRSLSAIFGTACVPMVWAVGSRMFGKRAGVYAALFVTASTFHVYYSQETRNYAPMTFFALSSFYFYLQRREAGWRSGAYLVSTLALLYTHLYGVFFVAAQNLDVLLKWARSRRPEKASWWGVQAVLFVLFLPWIIVMAHQAQNVGGGFWIQAPSWMTPGRTLLTYMGSRAVAVFFVAAFAALFVLARRRREDEDLRDSLSTALAWFLVPSLLPMLASLVAAPFYVSRYTIGASTAFYILAAAGVASVKSRAVRAALLAFFFAVSSYALWKQHDRMDKDNWRSAVAVVEREAAPGDLLVFNPGACQAPYDYYSKRGDVVKKGFPARLADESVAGLLTNNVWEEDDLRRLDALVSGHDRVWLIRNRGGSRKSLDRLEGSYEKMERRDFHKIVVISFQKRRSAL